MKKPKQPDLDLRIVFDDPLAEAIRASAEQHGRNIQQEVRFQLRSKYIAAGIIKAVR